MVSGTVVSSPLTSRRGDAGVIDTFRGYGGGGVRAQAAAHAARASPTPNLINLGNQLPDYPITRSPDSVVIVVAVGGGRRRADQHAAPRGRHRRARASDRAPDDLVQQLLGRAVLTR